MSLLNWLKKIFEIKPVQPKGKPTPVVDAPKIVENIHPVVVEPEMNVLKEGCVVEPAEVKCEVSTESSDQPAPKKKRTRKPRKPKDYNG